MYTWANVLLYTPEVDMKNQLDHSLKDISFKNLMDMLNFEFFSLNKTDGSWNTEGDSGSSSFNRLIPTLLLSSAIRTGPHVAWLSTCVIETIHVLH